MNNNNFDEKKQDRELEEKQKEVKYSLRQSMWKKTRNVFEIVQETKAITLPDFTSKEKADRGLDEELNIKEDLESRDANRFANEMIVDDLVVIFENGNKERALLAKIKSGVKYRHFPNVTIFRKDGYVNKYQDNVVEVALTNQEPTKRFDRRETMFALARDIEIIRFIDKEEPIFKKYWKFQGHIIRNRSSERFI